MNKEPFANLPDVLNAKQLAEALHLSKAGAYAIIYYVYLYSDGYADI